MLPHPNLVVLVIFRIQIHKLIQDEQVNYCLEPNHVNSLEQNKGGIAADTGKKDSISVHPVRLSAKDGSELPQCQLGEKVRAPGIGS